MAANKLIKNLKWSNMTWLSLIYLPLETREKLSWVVTQHFFFFFFNLEKVLRGKWLMCHVSMSWLQEQINSCSETFSRAQNFWLIYGTCIRDKPASSKTFTPQDMLFLGMWVSKADASEGLLLLLLLSHTWLFATPWTACSTTGFPALHYLPEFAQTHVHRVSNAIQPSHPLSLPTPPALHLFQHQGLFQWVDCLHQAVKVLELQLQHQSLQWTFRVDFL